MIRVKVVQRRMTAVMSRKCSAKASSYAALSQGEATDRLHTEGKRALKQVGQSGEEEPSSGEAAWSPSGFHRARQRIPRPSVLVGCEQPNTGSLL